MFYKIGVQRGTQNLRLRYTSLLNLSKNSQEKNPRHLAVNSFICHKTQAWNNVDYYSSKYLHNKKRRTRKVRKFCKLKKHYWILSIKQLFSKIELKIPLSGLRQFLINESLLKVMRNAFLLHVKNPFRSWDIPIFVFTFGYLEKWLDKSQYRKN